MNTGIDFSPWLGVFETLRVVDGVPLFLAQHAAELHRSATTLGLNAEMNMSEAGAKLPPRSGRWRWVVTTRGTETFFVDEESPGSDPLDVSLSTVRVGSQNWDARFKTVSYLSHAQALRMAATPEAILLNEHGNLASAARANLFWRRGDRLFTPAHEAGCRCGVVRDFVLGRREVQVGHFPVGELLEAEELFLTNSMRGIVSIRSLEGRSFPSFPAAEALRAEYAAAVKNQLARPVAIQAG